MPRAVPRDVSNFTILIVAPDLQQIRGTVGTHPVTAESVEARRLLGQNASSMEVSGDFRGEDPERISPYPYAVLDKVRYNGTWHVYINRTLNGDPATPYTGLNLANVNSCVHVGFSEPNRTLRIFSGDRAYESARPVSHAHLTFPYGSNFTIERYAADTCG